MTPVYIHEITTCTDHDRTFIVLQDARGGTALTIQADAGEAQRLLRQVRHGRTACHPIFDFVQGLLATLGAEPTHVVLDDVAGEGVTAFVHLRGPGAERVVGCYPSDALTLALRDDLPVFVTPAALESPPPPRPPRVDDASDSVLRWLDGVEPRDFLPPLDEGASASPP
jgi:bifunctional DNase/RNase